METETGRLSIHGEVQNNDMVNSQLPYQTNYEGDEKDYHDASQIMITDIPFMTHCVNLKRILNYSSHLRSLTKIMHGRKQPQHYKQGFIFEFSNPLQ